MDKNGFETMTSIVDVYHGYAIVKITEKKYPRSAISHEFLKIGAETIVYYTFCQVDCVAKPSLQVATSFETETKCKEAIDSVINDGAIYLTNEEKRKWVYEPNRKCSWAYCYKSLMKILKDFKKSDKRKQLAYIERLSEANFRHYADLLEKGFFDKYEKLAMSQFPIKTKLEIDVLSYGSEFKLGGEKALELSNLINEFLKGIKKNNANVSTIVTSNEGTLYTTKASVASWLS